MSRPPLSVVLPVPHRGPQVAPVLAALTPQAAECGAEIVVVDGSGALGGGALEGELPSCVTHVVAPGCDVFELRAIGVAAATGALVAIIEDHTVPRSDYCRAVLQAHADSTRSAIAGAIVNGSTERAVDRANFLLVHADNLPPRSGLPPAPWTPTPSNVSYKRAMLPGTRPAVGWLEAALNPALLLGDDVAFDDRVVVSHVQSLGTLGTFANHFRAGKTMGGISRGFVARGQRARWCARMALSLTPALVRRVRRLGSERPEYRGEVSRLAPLVIGLALCNTAGFVVGSVTGAGRSAARLH